jgi:hypothetical protein
MKENDLVKVNIPKRIKENFKILCQIKGITMTQMLTTIIIDLCDQYAEDIEEIRQKRI